MMIRSKIYTAGVVIFVIFVILAAMNITMHRKVLSNLKIRDQVNRRLTAIEAYVQWKNDLNLLVSDVVASGHVPRFSNKQLQPPADFESAETKVLVANTRALIALVDEKESQSSELERRYESLRVTINDLYYQLENKIATVLARIQMDQVLGRESPEKSSLAPYVLKSLNQLTLIALDSLLCREYSPGDKGIVERNRQFLSSQLQIIDRDGAIAALFDALFARIEELGRLIPDTRLTVSILEGRIAETKALFDKALAASETSGAVVDAESEVMTANAVLETTSRRTLVAAVICLLGVPVLLIAAGIYGLNRLVVGPITNIVAAMKAFEEGDFDTAAPVRHRDEIGTIAQAFNAMAGQIRTKVSDMASLSETLQAILEANANPIVVYNAEGWPQYLNPAFSEVFGWTLDELKGRRIPFVPEDQNEITAHYIDAVYATGNTVRFASRRLTKQGEVLDVVISAGLIRGTSDSSRGMVVNLTDISEQTRLEAQLRQAQKMESVGRLAGGVAHDFNNMLSVIMGYSELALEKIDPDDPLHGDMEEIYSAAKRSADITRQLLAFARKQTIQPKVIDLNAAVEETLKMLRRLIGEDVELLWRPAASACTVRMDPAQLDQILANLCVNARDAISGVGRIIIETETLAFDESHRAVHPELVPGRFAMIAVSDDGCGMDREVLEKLFEPFFTTKGLEHGTGLGLATVYGIVKQNKGFIYVYSEPDQGATFRIYLPRHAADGDPERTAAGAPPAGLGETILLVEDDIAILKLGRKLLEDLGYTVFKAKSPEEALHLAQAHGRNIRLLLTDVVMPGMDGRELAQRIRTINPEIRILYMSGHTADLIAHRGVLEEGVNLIHKPFSKADLAGKIREVLDC